MDVVFIVNIVDVLVNIVDVPVTIVVVFVVVVVVVDIVALIFIDISFRSDAINHGSSDLIRRDPVFPATAFSLEACGLRIYTANIPRIQP